MDKKVITRYYSFQTVTNNIQFHATVEYNECYGRTRLRHNVVSLQTYDEAFQLQAGINDEEICIERFSYSPKCSLEEYYAQEKDWQLAYHLLAAFQFLIRLMPETPVIKLYDKLSFDDGNYGSKYLYYYLSYFSLAQNERTWFEYYLGGEMEEKLSQFDKKPDAVSFLSGGGCPFADPDFIDKYIKEYEASVSIQEFLKGRNIATFGEPWLTWYMNNIIRFGSRITFQTSTIWKMKRIIGELYSSKHAFIEKPLEYYDYHSWRDPSKNNIIIRNEYISNCILSMADLDYESDSEGPSPA